MVEEGLRQLLPYGPDVIDRQVGPQQPDAAVDIEANPTGGDHSRRVGHIKRGDITDGEAVARVHIGKTNAFADDARQRGDISDLLMTGKREGVSVSSVLVAGII